METAVPLKLIFYNETTEGVLWTRFLKTSFPVESSDKNCNQSTRCVWGHPGTGKVWIAVLLVFILCYVWGHLQTGKYALLCYLFCYILCDTFSPTTFVTHQPPLTVPGVCKDTLKLESMYCCVTCFVLVLGTCARTPWNWKVCIVVLLVLYYRPQYCAKCVRGHP